MNIETLSFNLQKAKDEYACFDNITDNAEYINSLHSLAFSKDVKGLKAIAKLLIFFALKCKEFRVVAPKDEYGLIILGIKDTYEKRLEPSNDEICEAITSLLLECIKLSADYEKIMYLELREYISNIDSLNFKAMNSEYELPKTAKKEDERIEGIEAFDKSYVTKSGMCETYNPLTASNFQKLRVAEQIGEFKNAQVKERAIKAFKMLNNCEPTKDEKEKAEFTDNYVSRDSRVYNSANSRILNVLN